MMAESFSIADMLLIGYGFALKQWIDTPEEKASHVISQYRNSTEMAATKKPCAAV